MSHYTTHVANAYSEEIAVCVTVSKQLITRDEDQISIGSINIGNLDGLGENLVVAVHSTLPWDKSRGEFWVRKVRQLLQAPSL